MVFPLAAQRAFYLIFVTERGLEMSCWEKTKTFGR